ncbi:MAG: glycosyltransferase family 9 protein [Roseiflexaceae bacterium]
MTHRLSTRGDASVRRIAVLRALYLGDLLCAGPAFRALRRRFPAAEITLIGLPWAADLVRRLSVIDRLLPFPGYPGIVEAEYCPERTSAFFAEARAYRYDLAIQMHGDGSASNGFVAELGARGALGYRRGADRRLALSLPYRKGEHEIMRWLQLIAALDGHKVRAARRPDTVALEFPIGPDDTARAAELLFVSPAFPLVALHPGAKAKARRWPAERFAALADALIERLGADIVLTGSAGERQLTAAVRRAMHHPALDLAGETDLGAFAAVIARSDLLISNDTGAAHLAVAVGTPSVVLFGPGRPSEWGPLDRQRHLVIDAWALAGYAEDPAEALRRLPVEPVLAACLDAVERIGKQHTAEEQHATPQHIDVAYPRQLP